MNMINKNETIETRKSIQFMLAVILVIIAGAVLKITQVVVLPLIIAWLLSFLLTPPLRFLRKWHVPNVLAIVIVLVIVLGVIYLAGMFILQRVFAFLAAYPKYQTQWIVIINELFDTYELARNGVNAIDLSGYMQRYVLTFSSLMLKFVSNLILVIIFLFFILLGQPFSQYKITKMFSATQGHKVLHITQSTSRGIRRYLWLQFLISAVTGIAVAVALSLIGVDFAITWGALAFVLNFIPNIGSIVASIPPVLIAFVQYYPSFWPAIVTALALLAIQQTIGNFIAPKVLGDSLDLSPVVILVSLLFFGWMWGIMGAILSVPIAVAIKIACDNIEGLKFFGIMMSSGRKYRAEFMAQECANAENQNKDFCE